MDLRTRYMGLELQHPIVASASPLSEDVDNIRRMEDAGAAAVVMFSLFEEQLKHEAAAMEYLMEYGTESFAEALSYFPEVEEYRAGPERYLELLHHASQAVDIPVIGSLNGITNQGWIDYAKHMEEAGASGVGGGEGGLQAVAEGHEDIEELLQVPQPQPDPQVILDQQKFAHQQRMDELNLQLETLKVRMQAYKDQTGGDLNVAKAQELGFDASMKARQQQLQEIQTQAELLFKQAEQQQAQQQPTPNKETV